MKELYCNIHNVKIEIFTEEEFDQFKDNNEAKIAIFIDNNGNTFFKRYIKNKCNENCETIRQLFEEDFYEGKN